MALNWRDGRVEVMVSQCFQDLCTFIKITVRYRESSNLITHSAHRDVGRRQVYYVDAMP